MVNSQRVMHCPCGNAKVLALGAVFHLLYAEAAARRTFWWIAGDSPGVTAIDAASAMLSGRDKRSIVVHDRVPGRSVLRLMVCLCPGCHAKVHRTRAALSAMPPLLLQLWREQHPNGHEQVQLDFSIRRAAAQPTRLFS